MRSSRTDSAAIRDCAEKNGISVRAVQLWRKNSDPRWQSYLEGKTREAAVAAQMNFIPSPVETMTPEQEEQSSAARYARMSALADQAVARGDFGVILNLNKVAVDCHKILTTIRENNARLAETTHKLVPVEEVRAFITGNLAMARQQLENLPEVLAAQIPGPEVIGIVRREVEVILRELSESDTSAPWSAVPSSQKGAGHDAA